MRAAGQALALALAVLLMSVPSGLASGDVPPVVQTVMPKRLVVPSIGVDAPVVVLGLDEDGAMQSPRGPAPVGWYDFSPTPGNAGNTVFSGHRDWRTGVTGVFWRLGELVPGDRISVILADGSSVDYAVVLSVLMGPDDMPIGDVVGQTREEIITLITCEGFFNRRTREYDLRRVVWANRVAGGG
ncbi:MAG TPA: class F sortase [Chloroflexota bacterium]|nr:class F sortase [Chloroflexota bacterium]